MQDPYPCNREGGLRLTRRGGYVLFFTPSHASDGSSGNEEVLDLLLPLVVTPGIPWLVRVVYNLCSLNVVVVVIDTDAPRSGPRTEQLQPIGIGPAAEG